MNAWWPNGAIPRWKGSVPSGRAEPAPPGGRARGRRPSGEDPGLTRRAVFSEGRTLCVCAAGSYGRQGPSLPPEVRREAGGFIGIHGEGVRPSSRACGARPSAGRPSRAGMALRGKPGDGAKGDFLGGARSPRPDCRPGASRGIT